MIGMGFDFSFLVSLTTEYPNRALLQPETENQKRETRPPLMPRPS